MSSSLLSQMLLMVPSQCPQKNIAFSAAVPRSVSSRALFSGVSSGSYVVSVPERARRCSFAVRAEVKTDTELQVVEEPTENVGLLEADEGSESISEEKPPRQPRVRLGDIMGILNKRAVEASDAQRPIPELKTGDIVEIKLEVPENRKRLSVYKGIIISRQNAGIHTTIRVRRIIAGVGVEIVFPIYSPNIREIRVVSHRKVRRARLYYLRDKLPRLSTFK